MAHAAAAPPPPQSWAVRGGSSPSASGSWGGRGEHIAAVKRAIQRLRFGADDPERYLVRRTTAA